MFNIISRVIISSLFYKLSKISQLSRSTFISISCQLLSITIIHNSFSAVTEGEGFTALFVGPEKLSETEKASRCYRKERKAVDKRGLFC